MISLQAQNSPPPPTLPPGTLAQQNDWALFVPDDADPTTETAYEDCTVIPVTAHVFQLTGSTPGETVEVCFDIRDQFNNVPGSGHLEITEPNGFTFIGVAPSGNSSLYCRSHIFGPSDFTNPQSEDFTIYGVPQVPDILSGVIEETKVSMTIDGVTTVEDVPNIFFQDIDTFAYNFPNGELLSELVTDIQSVTTFALPEDADDASRNIVYNGTLFVDIDYEMGSVDGAPNLPKTSLHLGPNSRVFVMPDIELTLDDVHIYGCRATHNGIIVLDEGKLTLTNSNLQDALTAVTVNDGGELVSINSKIFNNEVGIRVAPTQNGNLQSTLITVIGSDLYQERFGVYGSTNSENTATNDLMLPPLFGTTAVAGAEFHDVEAGIYFASGPDPDFPSQVKKNNIQLMQNGLLFYNSAGRVEGTDFQTMETTANFPSGIGVLTTGDLNEPTGINAVRVGSPTNDPDQATRFTDMNIGIHSLGSSSLFVSHTSMGYDGTLIRNGIVGWLTGRFRGVRNDIRATRSGISMLGRRDFHIVNLNNIRTFDNDEGATSVGIRYLDLNANGPTFSAGIFDNVIEMKGGDFGLFAGNTRKLSFSNNDITWDSQYPSTGILVQGGNRPKIRENFLIGDDANSTTGMIGIDVQNVTRPQVNCNTLDKLETGIRFFGSNVNTKVAGNDFLANDNGLQLGALGNGEPLTLIGEQTHRKNFFSGPFVDFDARYESNVLAVLLSEFTVNPNSDNDFAPGSTNLAPGQWFDTDFSDTGVIPDCSSESSSGNEGGFADAVEGNFIDGNFTAGYWLPSIQFHDWYSDLTTTSLTQTTNWYNEISSNGVEDFGAIIKLFGGTMYPDTLKVNSIDGYESTYLTEIEEYELKTITALTTGVSNDSLRALDLNAALTANANARSVQTQLNSDLTSDLNQLASLNGLLSTDSVFQQNRVDVNDWEIDLLQYGSDTLANELSAILAIASQCPNDGGDAVYQARTLLSVLGDERVFDDVQNCNNASENITPPKPIQYVNRISPNPVMDLLTVAGPSTITSIELFDNLGRSVTRRENANELSKRMNLNVDRFETGMYTLRINYGDQESEIHKIVIH